MNRFTNPETVHEPLGKYSHTVGVPSNSEWLVISGQVGRDRDGNVPTGVKEQSEQAFQNVLTCLEANGMDKTDIVKFTVYLTDPRIVGEYRAARSKVIGDDVLPASTLLIVARNARGDRSLGKQRRDKSQRRACCQQIGDLLSERRARRIPSEVVLHSCGKADCAAELQPGFS